MATEDTPETRPAADVLSGGGGGEGGETVPIGSVRALAKGSLPVTGFALLCTLLTGVALMASGVALRTAGRQPA